VFLTNNLIWSLVPPDSYREAIGIGVSCYLKTLYSNGIIQNIS